MPSTPLKSLLPPEHGASAALVEAIVLGLVVGGSWAGFLLAMAAGLSFLARPALLIWLRKIGNESKQKTACKFALTLGISSFFCAAGALHLADYKLVFLWPFIFVMPLLIIFLWAMIEHKAKTLFAEIAGSLTIIAIAPAIVLIAKNTVMMALLVWFFLALRQVASIFHVRSCIRVIKHKYHNALAMIGIHLAAIAGPVSLYYYNHVTIAACFAGALLVVRSGLWRLGVLQPKSAKTIGCEEVLVGVCYITLVAISLSHLF